MSGGWYWCYRCTHRVTLPATCASSEPVCPSCGEGFLEQEAAAGASPLFRAFLLTGEDEDDDEDENEHGLFVDEDEEDDQELEDEDADADALLDELEDEELRVSRRLCRSAMITDHDDEDEDGDDYGDGYEDVEDEDEHDDDYEDDDLDIHWLGSGPSWASRSGLGSIVLGVSRSSADNNVANGSGERFGSLPASRSAIEAMPVMKFNGQFGADDDMQCAVCKDVFVQDVEIRQMPCGHFYHSDCILPWLALHSSCPVCRVEMPREGASVAGNGEQEQQQGADSRHGLGLLRMASSAAGFAIFGFDSPADSASFMVHPDYIDGRRMSTGNDNSRTSVNDSSAFGSSDDEWHNPLDWFLRH